MLHKAEVGVLMPCRLDALVALTTEALDTKVDHCWLLQKMKLFRNDYLVLVAVSNVVGWRANYYLTS